MTGEEVWKGQYCSEERCSVPRENTRDSSDAENFVVAEKEPSPLWISADCSHYGKIPRERDKTQAELLNHLGPLVNAGCAFRPRNPCHFPPAE